MDIRTKLVFAFVAVALGSVAVLGFFAYEATYGLLRDQALRQLDAVAESKQRDLEKVIVAWRDRAHLIASRTQLRLSLRRLQETGEEEEEARIGRILGDARESVRAVRELAVLDPSGTCLVASGAETCRDGPLGEDGVPLLLLDPDDRLQVALHAPLRLEDERIGTLRLVLEATELDDITQDYTGLGRTGETLVGMAQRHGSALVVNRLRHDPDAAMRRTIQSEEAGGPMLSAIAGNETAIAQDALDYRGEPVWAATRYLADPGWGIVVKADEAEQLEPVLELRNTMVRLSLSLGAFAILVGTLLGFYVSRPIRELADVATRIREGDEDLRAEARGEDEVGLLARAFNDMTERLVCARREAGSSDPPDPEGGGRSSSS